MPTAILETQPHSTEAEQTVIAALLLDPKAIFKIDAKLAPSDFYSVIQGLMAHINILDFYRRPF